MPVKKRTQQVQSNFKRIRNCNTISLQFRCFFLFFLTASNTKPYQIYAMFICTKECRMHACSTWENECHFQYGTFKCICNCNTLLITSFFSFLQLATPSLIRYVMFICTRECRMHVQHGKTNAIFSMVLSNAFATVIHFSLLLPFLSYS
jgi:hypothetical protein